MNNAKWTAFAIGYQCVFAYAIALVIYQIGLLVTGSVNVIGLIFAIAIIAFICYMLFKPYKESNTLKLKDQYQRKQYKTNDIRRVLK